MAYSEDTAAAVRLDALLTAHSRPCCACTTLDHAMFFCIPLYELQTRRPGDLGALVNCSRSPADLVDHPWHQAELRAELRRLWKVDSTKCDPFGVA